MGRTVKGIGSKGGGGKGGGGKALVNTAALDATSDTVAASPVEALGEAATMSAATISSATISSATLSSDVALASAPTMTSDDASDIHATVPAERQDSSRLSALTPVLRSHYEFISEYGRGGLGKISEARDLRTGRIVAIKEMLPSASAAGARFAREAVITANLQHPAIVPVYEVGLWDDDGGPFYAMKLVAGEPLEEVMRAAKTPTERLALLPQVHAVAEAIAYAHSQGIMHRDLKPANILVGDFGETVVIDWGLAKRQGDADDTLPVAPVSNVGQGLTLDGDVMGTPAYMSPEQAEGKAVDESTDVFAIGVILYELFAGHVPFAHIKNLPELLQAVREHTPPALASIAPGTPQDIIAIVEKAMAHRPSERYADGGGLADDLGKFQTGQLVGAREYSSRVLLARWVRKHRLPVAMAAAMTVTLAVGAAISVTRVVSEKRLAVHATEASNRSLAAAYRQMAIRQLERGRSLRALTYVSEAAKLRTSLSPTDRLVAGMAVAPLTPLEGIVIGDGEPLIALVASLDGTRAVAATKRQLRWFDRATWTQTATVKTTEDIRGALFLPDGRFLVVSDGARVHTHDGTSARIEEDALAVSITPDLQLLIGTRSGDLKVHSLDENLTELRSWKASEHPVWRVASNAGGRIIATDSDDVVLWDAETSEELGRIEAAAFPVFSPNGRRLAVISDFGYGVLVHVATAQTASIERSFDHGAHAVTSAIFSADGTAIITTAGSQLRWWDADTGTLLQQREVGEEAWLVGHTSELGCITANRRGRIEVHTPTGGLPLHATGSAPSSIIYSTQGVLVASAQDGHIYRWKLSPGALAVAPPATADEVSDVLYGPGSDVVLVRGNDSSAELRTSSGKILTTIGRPIELGAFSADGTWLALLHPGGEVTTRRLGDLTTPALPIKNLSGNRIVSIYLSQTGRFLATVDSENGIFIWNRETREPVVLASATALVKCLEFSQDEASAVACSSDGQSLLLDLVSGESSTLGTKHLWTNDAAFSPSGETIILGGNVKAGERGAVLLATKNGTAIRELPTTGKSATIVEFSPRAKRLVLGLADRIEVWDADATTLAATFPTGGEALTAIAFDKGEDLLLTSFESGDIALWDIESGIEVMRTSWGREASIALRADAQQVTVRVDGAGVVWNRPHFDGSIEDLGRLANCYSAWRIHEGAQILSQASPAQCADANAD